MDAGCPYIAGPACRDCDGSCWYPRPEQERPDDRPGPCEGCYYITDHMQECDGACEGLTAENLDRRRAEYAARVAI